MSPVIQKCFYKFSFGEQAPKWRTAILVSGKQASYRELLEEFKEGRLLEIITSNLRQSQKNKTGAYRTKSIQLLSSELFHMQIAQVAMASFSS